MEKKIFDLKTLLMLPFLVLKFGVKVVFRFVDFITMNSASKQKSLSAASASPYTKIDGGTGF